MKLATAYFSLPSMTKKKKFYETDFKVPPEEIFEFNPGSDAVALTCLMNPKNRSRVGF